MRNLLEIETGLLGSSFVQDGLNLSKIKWLQRTQKTEERSRFSKQLHMANLMKAGKEWFDKAETQQYFADNGVTWTSDELADKVFECGKSWMYKCIKASNVDTEVVDKFKEQCKVLQTDGYKVKVTIEELNKFNSALLLDPNATVSDLMTGADSVVQDTTETTETSETTEDSNTEPSVDTIFTMSYKLNAVDNVAVRYSAIDGLITTNTREEIKTAIAFLTEQL
jgi:hypothetical protein